ncbi:alpha/beta fold hydrolase [Mycolicibacterium komossense]|uniref:Alpha/beta hydrolase n=1 Tax=Mycolicibacterium komossense TaxID=1779 RepID=A0ABT3C5P8_9MYCO|nr:alpha/beta hydrolase [Mycolicibacterium komossense]MCV7224786.1 alpha/beta hydrolase [Mycolicibacterium komossense]
MPLVGLSSGPIEYIDTGGEGPVLVFVHGLLMNDTAWRNVLDDLSRDFRCVCPTLPLGGHRLPMNPDADLSLIGMAALLAEFLEALDLESVTIVQNDWGGAQVLIATSDATRVGGLVLTSCEAFEVYPPAPARAIVLAARIPAGLRLVMKVLDTRIGRRGPGAWGWMSKRPIPDGIVDAWFRPATERPDIRRDLRKYLLSVPSREELLAIAARSATFTGPVTVAWATEDRMFPVALGRRLAASFRHSQFLEIGDSYTLIGEDQPQELIRAVRAHFTTLAADGAT